MGTTLYKVDAFAFWLNITNTRLCGAIVQCVIFLRKML